MWRGKQIGETVSSSSLWISKSVVNVKLRPSENCLTRSLMLAVPTALKLSHPDAWERILIVFASICFYIRGTCSPGGTQIKFGLSDISVKKKTLVDLGALSTIRHFIRQNKRMIWKTNYVQTVFRYPPQVGFEASWLLGDGFHESSDLGCGLNI